MNNNTIFSSPKRGIALVSANTAICSGTVTGQMGAFLRNSIADYQCVTSAKTAIENLSTPTVENQAVTRENE